MVVGNVDNGMLTLMKNEGDAHLEVLVMAMEQSSKMSVMMRLGEEIHYYKSRYTFISPHTLSLLFLSILLNSFFLWVWEAAEEGLRKVYGFNEGEGDLGLRVLIGLI